jgi:hypothetical protein
MRVELQFIYIMELITVVITACGAWITCEEEKCRQYFGGETEGRDHVKDLEVDGRVIINGFSRTEMEGCSLG